MHYAAQATRLRAAGTPIGGNDLWIASHALAESATLVTNDMGEFGRIHGLVLENWVT
jgi:tRNA(fMet)-specific endonuclease VapC